MKPNRFFWEELEPPQWEIVQAMADNFGPPDPLWMREDEDGEYDELPHWQDKAPAFDEDGQVVYITQRIVGFVKVDFEDIRYEAASFEEMFICSPMQPAIAFPENP